MHFAQGAAKILLKLRKASGKRPLPRNEHIGCADLRDAGQSLLCNGPQAPLGAVPAHGTANFAAGGKPNARQPRQLVLFLPL